ncbi:nucleotidyl transferase AbiEii/AbiGii toxin family protein [bacterium]|nr:nucleotidyl transferase AbiEii/AbiGii toxin family protein [bacterium]
MPEILTLNGEFILTVALLGKSDLSILNKRNLCYKLADAEKDYLLAVVCKLIYESPLRNKLVFKGGTAIHHCYLPQTRFSEDLDFTSLDRAITLNEVKAVLKAEDFLEIKKEYLSEATIKIERLKYNGPLGLPNSLKVEIDYMQNVVLPAREKIYHNAWGLKIRVRAMDIKEICAEKIRAASERARYRDFYDLFLLLNKFSFNLSEIKELIKQKEIRKPITAKAMLNNWKIAREEKRAELGRIYYAQYIAESDMAVMIKKLWD